MPMHLRDGEFTADPLTAKQRSFVEEYLLDSNATQAAIRAGYSRRTARQAGAENLSKPVIFEEIAIARERRSERLWTERQEFADYLWAFLNADIADLFESDGTLKPVSEWPQPFRIGRLARIQFDEITDNHGKTKRISRSFRLHSRTVLIELLGRHLGAWV
jgi:phage terminase small subunit